MEDRKEEPIAFTSRTLSKSEKNYSQIELKALTLIFAMKKFLLYLCGQIFTLMTDYKPLTTILKTKRGTLSLAAARLQHWSLILSAYNYNIEYQPKEVHANVLTVCPDYL